VWTTIELFLESVFAGPMWPASVLLGLLLCYLALAILGAADLSMEGPDLGVPDGAAELPDADLAGGETSWQAPAGDNGGGLLGLGAISLRWLNLGSVPIILWLGTFTILFWCVSWMLWTFVDRPPAVWWMNLVLIGRNGVISVAATKIATNPMAKWFADASRYHPGTLIGETCEISTGEATPEFGQARFRTNGAPLLLNIRTAGGTLHKGDLARITAFDSERRIYTVTKADSEVTS